MFYSSKYLRSVNPNIVTGSKIIRKVSLLVEYMTNDEDALILSSIYKGRYFLVSFHSAKNDHSMEKEKLLENFLFSVTV